jgi:CRP/FNR family transcriptional regulator, nitrogen oxide reductase regulator
MSRIIPVLAETMIFAGLDSPALQAVQKTIHRRQVSGGQFIVRQGEPALIFYVLLHGYAKIVQVTPDGHQMLIRYIGPGQEFGLVAVLSGFDYPTSVQAVEECEVLAWEGELLAQLIERYPRIAFNALRVLALQNQQFQRRYQELLTERVEQRLAQAVLRLGAQVGRSTADGTLIEVPLSRTDLAEMVGTDMYTVSRIMHRWEQDGLVQTGRKSVQLLHQQALERLAAPD